MEAFTVILCAKRYMRACRRGIHGLQMTFADLQSAVPNLGFDDVGNWRRHTVAYNFPSALQVPAKALLFLDRQTEPQLVGCLTEAIDGGSPFRTSTNCSAQSTQIRDTGGRCI